MKLVLRTADDGNGHRCCLMIKLKKDIIPCHSGLKSLVENQTLLTKERYSSKLIKNSLTGYFSK